MNSDIQQLGADTRPIALALDWDDEELPTEVANALQDGIDIVV